MEALLALSQLVVFISYSENLFYKAESLLPGMGGRLTSLWFPEPPLSCTLGWDKPWQTALCMCGPVVV